MKKFPPPAWILAAALLLLVLLVTTGVWPALRGGPAGAGTPAADPAAGARVKSRSAASPGDATPGSAGPAKASDRRAKEGESSRTSAPEQPIDGDSPDVIRARTRASVPAGHSMVTGGHRLEDGSHEFAVITPKWLEIPEGSKQVEIEVELLNLDAAGLTAAGLDTLVTPDRKSEQNAEVWTPEEVARTMKDVDPEALRSKPRVIVSPGSPARMTVGQEGGVRFELDLSATETADGGFELTTDLKRVE